MTRQCLSHSWVSVIHATQVSLDQQLKDLVHDEQLLVSWLSQAGDGRAASEEWTMGFALFSALFGDCLCLIANLEM